jgi:hypothetical protein
MLIVSLVITSCWLSRTASLELTSFAPEHWSALAKRASSICQRFGLKMAHDDNLTEWTFGEETFLTLASCTNRHHGTREIPGGADDVWISVHVNKTAQRSEIIITNFSSQEQTEYTKAIEEAFTATLSEWPEYRSTSWSVHITRSSRP